MPVNVEPSSYFSFCYSSVRRMLERLIAPSRTSIDCKALMNALLRRLTSSSFGAPMTGVKAA